MRRLVAGCALTVALAAGNSAAVEAREIDPRILYHATLNTAARFVPRPEIETIVAKVAACTGINLGANFSRYSVATGLLMLREGTGLIFGAPAPALALVEPTKSGLVFAALGHAEGVAGPRHVLVAPTAAPGTAAPTVAIVGGSVLDDEGARWAYRALRPDVTRAAFLRVDSEAAALATLLDGRSRYAVLRQGAHEDGRALPAALRVEAVGPPVPLMGLARPTWLRPEDARRLEDCVFALRLSPDLSRRLDGADRFVPFDSARGLAVAREIGTLAGARFDRWNFRASGLDWR
jgi:hypothetical protein